MVNFCKALNETMDEYGITNLWLSEKSGLTSQTISNYKLGKSSIKDNSLEKIIEALPPDAREFYFDRLYPRSKTLRSLILKSTNEQKAEVLELISKSLLGGITEEGKIQIAV